MRSLSCHRIASASNHRRAAPISGSARNRLARTYLYRPSAFSTHMATWLLPAFGLCSVDRCPRGWAFSEWRLHLLFTFTFSLLLFDLPVRCLGLGYCYCLTLYIFVFLFLIHFSTCIHFNLSRCGFSTWIKVLIDWLVGCLWLRVCARVPVAL